MTTEDTATAEELCDLARRMGEAEKARDKDFFEELLSDALMFRRASGAIVNKKTFLTDLLDPANSYETLESRDIAARVYEGIAVSVALLVQARGTREGKPFDGEFRNIRIFLPRPRQHATVAIALVVQREGAMSCCYSTMTNLLKAARNSFAVIPRPVGENVKTQT